MKRSSWLLAATFAATLCLALGNVGVANVQFNFNSNADGWEFGTELPLSGTTPYWEWHKEQSSTDGAIRALMVASGSGAGAWAMSPCLDIPNNPPQTFIHVDISHLTAFPGNILGQVQFRIDATGTGWGAWQGVTGTSWSTTNHVAPTEANVFPPLLTSPGAPPNLWLAFSGTHNAATDPGSISSGQHVQSAFDLQFAEYGLTEGSEIQFRFMVGVNDTFPTQSPPAVLWEVNDMQIIGVKVCAVPEPGALTLAGVALACGLGGYARRRRRRIPVARQPDYGEATGLRVSPAT